SEAEGSDVRPHDREVAGRVRADAEALLIVGVAVVDRVGREPGRRVELRDVDVAAAPGDERAIAEVDGLRESARHVQLARVIERDVAEEWRIEAMRPLLRGARALAEVRRARRGDRARAEGPRERRTVEGYLDDVMMRERGERRGLSTVRGARREV